MTVAAETLKTKARAEAAKSFPKQTVTRVVVEPVFTASGQAGWSVLVVFKGKTAVEIDGGAANSFGLTLRRFLLGQGDEAFPYTRFLSESEYKELREGDARAV